MIITQDRPQAETSVRVRLRFSRSNKTGYIVGFVSQKMQTGEWIGVSEDNPVPKKICVLNRTLSPYVILNKLYDAEIVPMRNGNGFVAKNIELVQYPAKVITSHIPGMLYHVEAVFGGKRIVFDPAESRDRSVCDPQRAIEKLRIRTDVLNLEQALEEFGDEANRINQLYLKGK